MKTQASIKKETKKGERVDSFEIVEENNSTDRKCSMTVNYYYQGQYVGQQTYTASVGESIFEYGTCGEWKSAMIKSINSYIDSEGTMMPGGDYTG